MTWDHHQHFIGHLTPISHLMYAMPSGGFYAFFLSYAWFMTLWRSFQAHIVSSYGWISSSNTKGIFAFFPGNCCFAKQLASTVDSHQSTKSRPSKRNFVILGNLKICQRFVCTVFENHRKSLIQHCERSELRLHFEWTKVN